MGAYRFIKFDFHYWLIGDGPQKEEIRNLIERYNMKDTVFIMGFQKNPYPYLKASDIFVSTSFAEGFSLVIGEALCLEKPVISTKTSGATELLIQGKYGMLVDTDDESVYEGLKAMMSDESLRASYALKAKAGSITDIFDIRKNMQQINDCLNNVASSKTHLSRKAHDLFIDNGKEPGLLHGKMGKAIFFFHYAAFTDSKLYDEYAMELIEEISCMVTNKMPLNYKNGLAGIGVGLEYLIQGQFIEGDDDIFDDFDKPLHDILFKSPVSNFSLLDGYMGYAHYWICRLMRLQNKTDQKKALIAKSLDQILSIITTHITTIDSDGEKLDIYHFLFDLEKFPSFHERAKIILETYFDANYHSESDRKNFNLHPPSIATPNSCF